MNQKTIKIAILAEEPLGWGSGKHYFPVILDNYRWDVKNRSYIFKTEYICDKDIIEGKLDVSNYDVLLVPGGGVGDGEAVTKGFIFSLKVRRWKNNIRKYIRQGGSYIGICGGAALFTGLNKGENSKPKSFLEKLYNKSSLNISSVKHFYENLAFPLLYPFQYKHPEKIGAIGYVFSFSPGKTKNDFFFHSGGVPVDFKISKDNPIFSDFPYDTLRMRWWGGPGLVVPKSSDRYLKICAKYPKKDFSKDYKTKIFAWYYCGGINGIVRSFFDSISFIKKENLNLKDILMYIYYFAKPWKKSKKIIDLDFSDKPSITIEEYPNNNNGRIILCTSHPEYMIWWDGYIKENKENKDICIAKGFHKWENIKPFSENLVDELTYTWWVIRRFAAWAGKVPDSDLPPIEKSEYNKLIKKIIKENISWDGTILNQMKNI